MSSAGIAAIIVTIVVVFVSSAMLEYVLWRVVATLASVETPTPAPAPAVSIDTTSKTEADVKTAEDAPLMGEDSESGADKPHIYLTTSVRRTFSHLRRTSGTVRGLFRGVRYSALHNILFAVLTGVFAPAAFPGSLVGGIVAATLLAPIHAAATHAIVASTKTVPDRRVWKHLLLPAAVRAVPDSAWFLVPGLFALLFGWRPQHFQDPTWYSEMSNPELAQLGFQIVMLLGLGIVSLLFITLPARVALARVEASLIAPTDDAIVSLDRTFGGRAVSAEVKGEDDRFVVRFVEAWRSFDRADRCRLIKLGVKLAAIDFAVTVVGCAAIIGVVHAAAANAVLQTRRELETF